VSAQNSSGVSAQTRARPLAEKPSGEAQRPPEWRPKPGLAGAPVQLEPIRCRHIADLEPQVEVTERVGPGVAEHLGDRRRQGGVGRREAARHGGAEAGRERAGPEVGVVGAR